MVFNQSAQSPAPHEILYTYLRERKYCDVLIDRMVGLPYQDDIESLNSQVVHQLTLNDPLFAESQEQAPLLVRLPWTETRLIEKYLEYALREAADPHIQTRSVCAFLFSPLQQTELGKRLTKRLDVSVQTVGRIYFRYFDPRVTHHLPRVLNTSQLVALLDGVQSWLYVNWQSQLSTVTSSPWIKDRDYRLTFTSDQWRQLQDIESFNLAVRMLQSASLLADKPRTETETQLVLAVQSARATGLSTAEDRAFYAVNAFKFGTRFTRHPAIPDVIHASAQGVPLVDALAHYTGITPETITIGDTSDQRVTT